MLTGGWVRDRREIVAIVLCEDELTVRVVRVVPEVDGRADKNAIDTASNGCGWG